MSTLRRLRSGRDLTLMLHGSAARLRCEEAAQALARLGIEAELIELTGPVSSGLADMAALQAAVRRTGRLACVTGAGPAGTQAQALLAAVAEEEAGTLMRPPLRIVLPPEPLPLEHLVQPLVQLVAGPRAAG